MNLQKVLSTSVLVLFASLLAPVRAAVPRFVQVFDVNGLYDAVNNPGNAGAQVVLAAGYYALSPIDAASNPRPNNGRLELQQDMTLSGEPGHPEAAVIDAVGLPQIDTAAVRTGRGSNTIEWLSVKDAATGQSGIDTGLVSALIAHVRLAHLIVEGNVRGFDIRNDATAAGRILQVDLEDNDLSFNQIRLGIGIRLVNVEANGAVILATLRGNNLHDNRVGLVVANLDSSGSIVAINSNADHFDQNNVGISLFAGNANLPPAHADGNVLSFEAHGGTISDNTGLTANGESGGVLMVGGQANEAHSASNNVLRASLTGARLSGNQGADINVWGARTDASSPAGTGNHVVVVLQGVSRQAIISPPVPSAPADPGGTNTVTILR